MNDAINNANQVIAETEQALGKAPDQQPTGIYAALATFQEKVAKIDLDGEVKTKAYTFRYATLGNIIDKIKPAMKAAGLAYTQTVEGDKIVTTVACAKDGSLIRSTMPIAVSSDPKQVGASITYFRRYCLVSMLGIAGEEDKDAPEGEAKRPLPDSLLAKALARIAEGDKGVLEQTLQHFEVSAKQVRQLVKAEG
jgi:hypothetical protein